MHERRRAARVTPGPLGVRLFRSEGTLLNISLTGALVRLPRPQTSNNEVTLILDWNDHALLLRARIVRSVHHRVQLPDAVLKRTEHHVALEFVNLPSQTTETLSRLLDRITTASHRHEASSC